MKHSVDEKDAVPHAACRIVADGMPFAERFASRTFIGDLVVLGTRHLLRQFHSGAEELQGDVGPARPYVH